MQNKYQALLYYGIEENEAECDIFHAFHAADPAASHDDERIANDLAAQLDCTPDEDHFQCRSMYIDLPASLIQRIQKDAVCAYLENLDIQAFCAMHSMLADRIFREVQLRYRMEDVEAVLEENACAEGISEEELRHIATQAENALSKNDAYSEVRNLSIENTVEEHIKNRRPVARIDFLGSKGDVVEQMQCFTEAALMEELRSCLGCGVPLTVVLYKDENGSTISRKFLDDLDTPPKAVLEEAQAL